MGHKIKTFAKVLIALCIISCVIVIVYGLRMYGDNHVYESVLSIKQTTGQVVTSDDIFFAGRASQGRYTAIYGGIGIVASVISLLPLYWFGCLFERVESIEQNMWTLLKRTPEKP